VTERDPDDFEPDERDLDDRAHEEVEPDPDQPAEPVPDDERELPDDDESDVGGPEGLDA